MCYPSLTFRATVLTAGLLCAAGIQASDGQLEINQACAINTGCFPGDAPGFPVTIVQPGSYRLTGNLDLGAFDPGLSGIQVNAPAVTIDLGGFYIAGATTCSSSGVSISCSPSGTGGGSAGVQFASNAIAGVVQNGFVRNMTNFGIFSQATGLRVRDVTAIHNGRDGINGREGSLVVNSVVIENGQDGIDVHNGSMVDGVTAIGNGRNGVHGSGIGSVVTRTTARGNGLSGVNLLGLSRFGPDNASQSNAEDDRCGGGICTERKRIYLTQGREYYGDEALNACSPGFHMASITELHDPGKYDYDTILGWKNADSGSGIPTIFGGWARSGGQAHAKFNCSNWTSRSDQETGTFVLFARGLSAPPPGGTTTSLTSYWAEQTDDCGRDHPVWCVE